MQKSGMVLQLLPKVCPTLFTYFMRQQDKIVILNIQFRILLHAFCLEFRPENDFLEVFPRKQIFKETIGYYPFPINPYPKPNPNTNLDLNHR